MAAAERMAMSSRVSPASERASRSVPEERRTGFLTAPFSGRTWRETLQLLVNLPVGIATFCWAVIMVTAGAGLVITFMGLPILALACVGARGFAAMERARARALLRVDAAGRAPLRRQSGWIATQLRDGGGWRALLYSVLLLPLGVVSFTVALTFWTVGLTMALYPLYEWVFPRYVGWPGMQVFQDAHRTIYLDSVPEIAGVCAVGVVLVFVTPWIVRGLANLQRAMVRGLCG
ncbi:sensor domain-containing protein [Phaeacidiphilus oryzae]|uniref:sensor domain-containing protein n=1 Tax=Phaeacidiphilus oryzae TaxID=348818 RepID=UPI0013784ECD|nr:sensor domain-containing protein [Phaeacidiphilus oryzae]